MGKKYFAKKYRKYKKGYRKWKKLSNKYIYGSKGAKAQASQIAALRNKVDAVYKICKPEYKLKMSSIQDYDFSNGTGSYDHKVLHLDCCDIPTGNSDSDRTGDKVRSISLQAFLNAEYTDSITGTTAANEGRGGTLRFIYFQSRSKVDNLVASYPSPADIVSDYTDHGNNYQLNTIRPLKRGITEKYNILEDKTFTLTYDKSIKTFKFDIPNVRNLRYEVGASTYTYNVVYCLVLATGFRWDSQQTYTIKLQLQHKFVYTDA